MANAPEDSPVPEKSGGDADRHDDNEAGAPEQPGEESRESVRGAAGNVPAAAHSAKPLNSQTQAGPGDGLPESEPLTPELVKDEAVRGDFMLRAFVFVLAILMASTEIAETTTLVHVKTGQYLAAHGWLPSGQEVFSYTANGRPWVDLSWLFDLTLSGVYAVGGAKLLTVFKAGLVAVTFFLILRCVRPGVSTWWGSIAAALALLAAHPLFTALPELVTLLGLAVMMWILFRWQSAEPLRGGLWWLVPLFVAWSNLDGRMFLGLAFLALYALGEFVGSLLGSSGIGQTERRRHLWAVLGVCVAAACLNPFGWNALTEPLRLYGVEYPALRNQYAGSTSAVYLGNMSLFHWSVLQRPHVVAGLVLLAAAFVTIALNRRQVDYGHLFVLLGSLAFAAAASHELAAAAVVASVIATVGGQDWYRDNFSQTYSVELRERLFSSGGRAVTVLALFAIAFLAASGRLKDPAGRRIGLGFTPELKATITGLRQDVEDSFDNRPFHFVLRQGDLLIWLDQQPFIDSRVVLYSGNGQNGREDLIALHHRTRQSLRARIEGAPFSGRDEIWKAVFDRYDVTHVLPRLSGLSPDYLTLFSLQTPRWSMTKLGSMTATIYRTDTRRKDAKLDRYLNGRTLDLVDEAFRQEDSKLPPRPGWPHPRSIYQNLLSSPRPTRPIPVQTALHYAAFLRRYQDQQGRIQLSAEYAAAIAHLAIRHANRGLVEDPDCADAFQVLGDSYAFLSRLETSISRAAGGSYDASRRYRQTVAAYNQAILLDPDRPRAQIGLFYAYRDNKRYELALEALRAFEALTDFESDPSEEVQAQQTGILQVQDQLQAQVEASLRQIDLRLSSPGVNPIQAARLAYGAGCVLRSLELLEQDPDLMSDQPDARLFYALLLGEAGRVEEADALFVGLEPATAQYGLPGWQTAAAWTALAGGDDDRAVSLWIGLKNSLIDRQLSPLLAPLATTGPSLLWTPFHSQAVRRAVGIVRRQSAQALFHVALTHLEAGRPGQAADAFRQVLKMDPNVGNRPLISFYLFQITGERTDIRPPSPQIPLEPNEMFTPEPDDGAAAANSDDPKDAAGTRYDGLTLTRWRERIKDLDPNDPASADAVPGLIQIVRDTDAPWHSRRQAALTLGRIGPAAKQAIPLLIALLDERGAGENTTSLWAAKALGLFGPEAKSAAPVLIRRLQDESSRDLDRRAAIEPLSQIGTAHPQVVPALIRSLSSSTADDELRGLAAEGLGYIGPGGSAAVPALMRTARADDELLRRRSVAALGAMSTLADVAVPTLAELMVFDESAAVRDRAADSLSRIGKASIPVLAHLLADEDVEVRWRAAMALGKIGPPAASAIPSLKTALKDAHPEVRIHAIEALWAVQGNAATIIPPLLDELVNEDRQIRIRAYRLLISLEDEAAPAMQRLTELLADERPFVRQIARQALNDLADSDGTN